MASNPKKLWYNIVNAVKHDTRWKDRLVIDSTLVETLLIGTYSSVVSLRVMRICLSLAKDNEIRAWSGTESDISNAYLKALPMKKIVGRDLYCTRSIGLY